MQAVHKLATTPTRTTINPQPVSNLGLPDGARVGIYDRERNLNRCVIGVPFDVEEGETLCFWFPATQDRLPILKTWPIRHDQTWPLPNMDL